MKRTLSLIVIAFLLVGLPLTSAGPLKIVKASNVQRVPDNTDSLHNLFSMKKVCKGDVNFDGKITALDSDIFAQWLFVQPTEPIKFWATDINSDQHIDFFDIDPFLLISQGKEKAKCTYFKIRN